MGLKIFDDQAHTRAVLLARQLYGDTAIVRHRENMWWVDPRAESNGRERWAGLAARDLAELVLKLEQAVHNRRLTAASTAGKVPSKETSVDESRMLDSREAAKVLGVSPHLMPKLGREGLVSGKQVPGNGRMGMVWRFDPQSVSAFKKTERYARSLEYASRNAKGQRTRKAMKNDAAAGPVRRRRTPKAATVNPKRSVIDRRGISVHLPVEQVRELRELQTQLLESENPLLVAAGGNIFELARAAIVVGMGQMRKGLK